MAADAGRARYGDLHDPANNARAAYDISHHGSDMSPWTTAHTAHRDAPSYRRFLDRVEQEVGVQGDPRGVPGYGSQPRSPMSYDDSYDRIDAGKALAGGSGTVPTQGAPDGDADADGLTDAFEKLAGTDAHKTDTDHDGLTDTYEATISHTDPLTADTDHDGTTDPDELTAGTDPGQLPGTAGVVGTGPLAENVRNGVEDTDHDGLSDHTETVLHTDAKTADTDHDGLTDGQEQALGTDPLASDTDHDGLTDALEVEHATNPLDDPVAVPAAPPAPPEAKPSPPKEADSTKLDVFLSEARDQIGDRYVYGAPRGAANNANDNPKTFDCSSFTQWAAHRAGVELPGTAEQQYRFLKGKDRIIDVDEALHTKGALLFYFSREPTSSLPAGQAHVAISDGRGGTIEAKGSRYGVGEWSAKGRFNFAGVVPGLSDAAPEPKAAPEKDAFAIDDGKPVGTAATVVDGLPGAGAQDGDADADGLTDAFEKLAGTDAHKTDTDHDGLTDTYEATISHTDPLTADTDHDGTTDPDELTAGTDPGQLPGTAGVVGTGPLAENVRNGVEDTDHDGLSDHTETVLHTDAKTADTDHDGLTDALEVEHATNPLGTTTLGAPLGSDATGGSGSPLADPAADLADAAPGSHGSSLADALDHG